MIELENDVFINRNLYATLPENLYINRNQVRLQISNSTLISTFSSRKKYFECGHSNHLEYSNKDFRSIVCPMSIENVQIMSIEKLNATTYCLK